MFALLHVQAQVMEIQDYVSHAMQYAKLVTEEVLEIAYYATILMFQVEALVLLLV
jgi:hypothetical protein